MIRRQFLRRAVGACGAALVGPQLAGAATPADGPPIIDTHQHLWNLDRLPPPWLKPSDGLLYRSYVLKDYLEAVRGLNVVQAVYMEVDVAPAQQDAEADYVRAICRRGDAVTRAAVIGGRPGDAGFRRYITRFKGDRTIRGIREILKPKPGEKTLTVSDEFIAGLRLLGELGMSFDLCLPPTMLAVAGQIVDRCGDTRFILDHCGNADPLAFAPPPAAGVPRPRAPGHDADQWRRDIEALARRKNLVCKISGIVSRVNKDHWRPDDLAPIVNHCLDSFGPERVMFAGDWPVCLRGASLRAWIEALRQIVRARPADQQRKLFHDNARQYYGL